MMHPVDRYTRPQTPYKPAATAMQEGHTLVTETGAACPTCGTKLESVAKIVRSIPGDGHVEVHVAQPVLRCPSDGCDKDVISL
jgi:hypothetical protein